MADNASITILRNTQANINAEPIKDGNILFTTDQAENKIYADVGTTRIKIGGTVDVDTTLSTTSTNPVQNKVITNSVNAVRGQICTNLLNPTAQTQTINGVTFTNNGDGTYTLNGTASGFAQLSLMTFNDFAFLENKKLIGCPAGGGDSTYMLYISCYRGSTWLKEYYDQSNGVIISNFPSEATNVALHILIRDGQTLNNLTFKPMVTADLSATYDDFVPYTGDSGRLNEDVANFFDVIRPVGSLYPTTDANFNPNTAKGWHGKWERIKDCVIYASGDSDTVGSIVGSNTHELTIAELPRHTHSIPALSGTAAIAGAHTHNVNVPMPFGSDWTIGQSQWSASSSKQNPNYIQTGTATSAGAHTHPVTTEESTTGSQGSGIFIDMRPRRLNSIVWRRTA